MNTLPAPLPGMAWLNARNHWRLIGWAIRSRLHGVGGWWACLVAMTTAAITASHVWRLRADVTITTAAAATALLMFTVGAAALVAAVQLVVDARRRRRGWLVGYSTIDACQLVYPNPAGAWVLSDHFARRRGRRLAAAFRRRVFSHLSAEADRHHAVIIMATHSSKLAQIYVQDMSGLRVVAQRNTINGATWDLQRDPGLSCGLR